MGTHTLLTRLGTDLDTLRQQSICLGTEDPDIGWYVYETPDGQWIAWGDADPANPAYALFPTREEAIAEQHSGYRAAYPAQFTGIEWISVNQITDYPIDPPAIRHRIRHGKWPLGHVRWAVYPANARWEVTRQSLQD